MEKSNERFYLSDNPRRRVLAREKYSSRPKGWIVCKDVSLPMHFSSMTVMYVSDCKTRFPRASSCERGMILSSLYGVAITIMDFSRLNDNCWSAFSLARTFFFQFLRSHFGVISFVLPRNGNIHFHLFGKVPFPWLFGYIRSGVCLLS